MSSLQSLLEEERQSALQVRDALAKTRDTTAQHAATLSTLREKWDAQNARHQEAFTRLQRELQDLMGAHERDQKELLALYEKNVALLRDIFAKDTADLHGELTGMQRKLAALRMRIYLTS